MYVRITRGRFNPATEDDVQRIVEEQVIPALQGLPGFQRYIGMANRSAGTICAVSFWDSDANANFGRDVLMDAVPALMQIGVSLEPAEVYEVTLDV
jgi:hypothetical protein